MKIRLLYNRIIIANTINGPLKTMPISHEISTPGQPAPTEPTTIKPTPTEPTTIKPAAAKPSLDEPHLYGTNPEPDWMSKGHRINFRDADDFEYANIQRDSPHWDMAEQAVRQHFGGKIGLNDLAQTYSLPGMSNQTLDINHDPEGIHSDMPGMGMPGIGISYAGHSNAGGFAGFAFELNHIIHNDGNHQVYWENMRNNDNDSAAHTVNFLRKALEMYPRAGIKGVSTDAYSRDGFYNGAHTWANLGFDFEYKHQREATRLNLTKMAEELSKKGVDTSNVTDKIQKSTHPFEMKKISHQLALLGQKTPVEYGAYGHEIKHPNGHESWNHALGGDGLEAKFNAYLRNDPNDKGYQRMMSLLKR